MKPLIAIISIILVIFAVNGFSADKPEPYNKAEGDQFKKMKEGVVIFSANDPHHKRALSTYYQRRAYVGAPPYIPHEIPEVAEVEENDTCLSCHGDGGYVKKWSAYAPTTPHKEFTNCRQCHVPQTEEKEFVRVDWKSIAPPPIKRSAIAGSPPAIPHSLQLREDCLSCHSGPSAVREIRTPHPERIHCQQCHVGTLKQ